MSEKPTLKNLDDILEYLDDLRDSGVADMSVVIPFIRQGFALTMDEAKGVLEYWTEIFYERHPNG